MRKIYLLYILLFSFTPVVYAQNPLPNPGFENWTLNGNYYNPDNWNTLNPNTIVLGILTATRAMPPDVHGGNLAIKLTTKVVFGLTANGIASTGTIITTPPYGVTGGIPFSGRPDSIAGWYKYLPQGTDSGFVQYLSLDANNDTVAFVRWSAPNANVTSYTRFSKALTYYSSNTPAIAQWILSSSRGSNPVVNSVIYLDDLELITNPVGITEDQPESDVRVYANLQTGMMTVMNPSGLDLLITVFDATGKKLLIHEMHEKRFETAVRLRKNGMYLYRVTNRSGRTEKSGKMIFF